MRTTVFDLHNTRSVLDCQEEITRQIEAIHKNPKACVNPVTPANVHLQLGANENPLETTTAQVLAIVQGIARRLPREKAPMADEATLLIVRDFFTELSTIIAENRENFPDETVFKKCLERLWQIGGLFTGFLYSADSRLVLSNPTSSTDHPKLLICARETFGELSAKLRGASMVAYLQQYLK
ncbi:MAG: hypothetical protein IID43_03185 [Planctomycetes bacterium]|nr:hypothetical protein [Planctomycetota bacterium]